MPIGASGHGRGEGGGTVSTTRRSPAARTCGRSRKLSVADAARPDGRRRAGARCHVNRLTHLRGLVASGPVSASWRALRARRHEVIDPIAPTRQLTLDQRLGGPGRSPPAGSVRDVLTRERVLLHLRAHVAGVDGVDT